MDTGSGMGHSGWFKVSEASGPEWARHPDLAEVSEAAGLTVREAQVVLLFCLGLSYRAIGATLALSKHKAQVGRYLWRATVKLGRAHPQPRVDGRAWANDVLLCLRNRRQGGSPPTPLIGKDDLGRTRVWCYRSRPFGTVPEDLCRLSQEPTDAEATLQEVTFLGALAAALRRLAYLREVARLQELDAAEAALLLEYVGHRRSLRDLAEEREVTLTTVARDLDALELRLGPYAGLLVELDAAEEASGAETDHPGLLAMVR